MGQHAKKIDACNNGCSGHGICRMGECFCHPGYTGLDCGDAAKCHGCSGHGICSMGRCFCDDGFAGWNCKAQIEEQLECPEGCNKNGICHMGKCFCNPQFVGSTCDKWVNVDANLMAKTVVSKLGSNNVSHISQKSVVMLAFGTFGSGFLISFLVNYFRSRR